MSLHPPLRAAGTDLTIRHYTSDDQHWAAADLRKCSPGHQQANGKIEGEQSALTVELLFKTYAKNNQTQACILYESKRLCYGEVCG
jgi:hypothetical protein